MTNRWPKKGFIYFFLMLNFYIFSMEKDDPSEGSSASTTIQFQAVTEEMVNSNRVPPLEILLEPKDLNFVLTIAHKLQKKEGLPRKGLLIHGPAGCGKFSIAWNICLIAQFEFAAVEACDLINEGQSERDNVASLFAALNRNSPMILFVYNFEDLVKNNGTLLNKFAHSLAGFKRANMSVFLIGSTHDSDISTNTNIISLFRTLNVGLPSFKLREKILKFYCDKTRIGKDYGHGHVFFGAVATACENCSGADIKEIVESSAIAMEEKLKNNYPGLFWFKMKNYWDWKNRKVDSVCFTIACHAAPFEEIYKANAEGYVVNHLFGFCKYIQEQNQVGGRTFIIGLFSKFKWLASNTHLLRDYIGTPLVYIIQMGAGLATGGASRGLDFVKMIAVPLVEAGAAGAGEIVKKVAQAECDKIAENNSEAYKKLKEKEKKKEEENSED